MPINDFHKGTTLYARYLFQTSGSAIDISSDEITFMLKDSDEIVLTSSLDVASSGSIGYAILDVSSSLTNLSASCYQYEIFWHRSNGEDYVFEKTTVNILDRVLGSV